MVAIRQDFFSRANFSILLKRSFFVSNVNVIFALLIARYAGWLGEQMLEFFEEAMLGMWKNF